MKSCVLHAAKKIVIEDRPIPEPGPGMVRLRLAYVGVCGSDLHYYHEGRIGASVVKEPMVLGHEMSGIVEKLGPGVTGLEIGMPVTVNPSDECGKCVYCLTGRQNLCPSLKYLGSAAKFPHKQGIMQEFPVAPADKCIVLAKDLPLDIAACIEPLGIALHAASMAGNMLGKKVFISGAGPIGALIAAVAKYAGAAHVAISDMEAFPLSVAKMLGADETILLRQAKVPEDCFDICFEASGAPPATATALAAVSRGGRIVHVGFLPPEGVLYPVSQTLISKEITACGALRAYHEFKVAADILQSGSLDVSPLITGVFALDKAEDAILAAGDKSKHMKVLLKA